MASRTTVPASAINSASNKNNKRHLSELLAEELFLEIEARDASQIDHSGGSYTTTKPTTISPEKGHQECHATQKDDAPWYLGTNEVQTRPDLKNKNGMISHSSMCDESTFRAFMGLAESEKCKGGKMAIAELEDLLGSEITTSIRDGYLSLKEGTVNITFNKNVGNIKVTGHYGLAWADLISSVGAAGVFGFRHAINLTDTPLITTFAYYIEKHYLFLLPSQTWIDRSGTLSFVSLPWVVHSQLG